jgi:hypothetical protein
LLNIISKAIKETVIPGKEIVIDESMVPWRGRLLFCQYIPGKSHKYGVKLYKLCLPGGYTYSLEVYTGANPNFSSKGHAYNIVMLLIDGLLFSNRTLYTDNFYTSIPLAEDLLKNDTFLCGTVRTNKKFLPHEKNLKQKRGEVYSAENKNKVKYIKWTDKRPVHMLTTREDHTCKIVQGPKEKLKPDLIFDYNNIKKGVDISDQLGSYYTVLRKTIKWYRKIVLELVCTTLVVNAYFLHKRWGTKKYDVLRFRELIIDSLLGDVKIEEKLEKKTVHCLEKFSKSPRISRKRCHECYKRLSGRKSREYAIKKARKVNTFCKSCENQPPMCLKCFKRVH